MNSATLETIVGPTPSQRGPSSHWPSAAFSYALRAAAIVLLAAVAGCDDGTQDVADAGIDAAQDVDDTGTTDVAADTDVERAALPDDWAAEFDTAIVDNFRRARAPGGAFSVAVQDLGVYFGAAGLSYEDPDVDLLFDDRFRVGSITKILTAVVIFQLENEGLLDRDDALSLYVTGLNIDERVTIRQLLNHTSGVYNYTDDPNFLQFSETEWEPEEVIAWGVEHGDLFDPGTDFTYSNTGYYLLGLVIESVTQGTYEQAIRARILDPVGMRNSFVRPDEPLDERGIVDGFAGGAEVTDRLHASWMWAAGGLISNTEDLCVFMDTLFAGELLPLDRVEAMMTQTELADVDSEGYGLGLQTITLEDGTVVVGHTGSTMGFNSTLFYEIDRGICVTGHVNDFFGGPEAVTDVLWPIVLDRAP